MLVDMDTTAAFQPVPKGTLIETLAAPRRLVVETDLGGMGLVAQDDDGLQIFVWRNDFKVVQTTA